MYVLKTCDILCLIVPHPKLYYVKMYMDPFSRKFVGIKFVN